MLPKILKMLQIDFLLNFSKIKKFINSPEESENDSQKKRRLNSKYIK
jgi:hypothetical protein